MNRNQIKFVAKTVVGFSVAYTVANIVKNNVAPKNTLQKAEMVVGAYVIGSMVAAAAERYTDRQFDAVYESLNTTDK